MTQTTPSSLNVAVVVEQFDPHGGGAERSTAQIVDELLARRHRVTIITGACPRHAESSTPGLEIHPFTGRKPRGAWGWRRFSAWATQRIRQGRFDVSLSMTMMVPATVLQPRGGTVRETLQRNLATRASHPTRLVKRVTQALSPKQQMLLQLERRTLADPAVKRVIAVSRYVQDQLRRHYQFDPSRIELIPNAATMPSVSESQRHTWRDHIRRGFEIPPHSTAYLFAALNPRLKGLFPLLYATQRLVEQGLNPVVLLVTRIRYAYQHLAATLGIREHVRFLGMTQHMAPLYAAADATVLPTFYDPCSKVVIESLMMGTPAISTAYNGASDCLREAATGSPARGRVIADPGDVPALAQAMADLADPQQRRLCAQATAGLDQELSMTRHVDQLEQVLRHAGSTPATPLANEPIPAQNLL